jgi:hypothetical protein
MTPAAIGKFVETVGVPVTVAVACGFLVWWLLKWLTGSLGNQISDVKQEIKDETDDLHGTLKMQHTMLVRLIDRVRTLEINTMMANTALLTKNGCDIPEWRRPRSERIANLKEEIKDVSHNGEGDE